MFDSSRYQVDPALAEAFVSEARISTDPTDVAAALARLLAAYEPDARYVPIRDGAFYGPRLRRLATLQLRVLGSQAKFKVGPAPPPQDAKRRVAGRLREGG